MCRLARLAQQMTIIPFFLALLWTSMIINYLLLFHYTYHNLGNLHFWGTPAYLDYLMLLFFYANTC